MPEPANIEQLPLRDIHLPEPIGWWPPAPGWWGLAVLVLALMAGLALWWRRRRRRPGPVQIALANIARLEADATLSPVQKAQALSILMRRVALSLYPRETVAGLSGEDWLRWLDEVGPRPLFSEGHGRGLVSMPYAPDPAGQLEALLAHCRTWLTALAERPGRTPS
ncbi:hypothetical protein JCM19379_25610 [Methyloparacoccus murrellii]